MKATLVIGTVGVAALLCAAVARPEHDARARRAIVVRHDRPASVEAVVAAVEPQPPAPPKPPAPVVVLPQPDEQTSESPARLRQWLLALTPAEFAPLVGSPELDRWAHVIASDISLRNADGEQPPRDLADFLEALNARILAASK
jgi:hypothetical protein